MLSQFDLTGKTAVVTGGTGLYGVGFCRALAGAGAEVIVTSRSRSSADGAAAVLVEEGMSAAGIVLDQADPGSVRRFADEVAERYGAVDVLVNNAVHRAGGDLQGTSVEDWDATSAANSRGLFLVTQALAAGMRERGSGSIINIGSIYGLVAPDFRIYDGTAMTMPAFYAYDKAGMLGLTRYLAAELGPCGIRVNCLSPGGLRSEGQHESFVAAYEGRVPLRRMAGEGDVEGALIFLASEASRYVTGVSLPVDGGWSAM